MKKNTKEMERLISSAKETQAMRYARVSSGISNRSAVFIDRKKKAKKLACRKGGVI